LSTAKGPESCLKVPAQTTIKPDPHVLNSGWVSKGRICALGAELNLYIPIVAAERHFRVRKHALDQDGVRQSGGAKL
jgi:hypothetical protein